ncbi:MULTISPECIES: hypothetical protein [Desulfobacter]|jgi:hypothetical protein|uniref:hypothetical protein n=1 Tax=Desulfobacter TaxID=2289 RepID=UPI000E8A52DD|nr:MULTISPECIES: hypothetical protein [Desulfobacter]MDX9965018.1 hypothetical protein [Desulfobacter postgatei]HBT88769.1 hypothetical protein [Desulfobacter sp.]
MSYYIDPNTQQMYYQAPAQSQQNATEPAAAAEPKVYAVPQNYAVHQAPPATSTFLGLDLGSATFWKGVILGTGVALLVTSETVQRAVVKTVSKGMAAASAGVEELKEKFEDAKAEVEAEASGKK